MQSELSDIAIPAMTGLMSLAAARAIPSRTPTQA
jgi:hypothetical protein